MMQDVHPVADRLYPRLLGRAWADVHPAVRRVHTLPGAVRAQAQFEVRRAPGRPLGWLLTLARVPAGSDRAVVRLAVGERRTAAGPQERWQRMFDGRPLVTFQTEAPGRLLSERVGPLEFRFRLRVDGGSILFEQEGCWLRLGWLAVRLPQGLAPRIWCRESSTDRSEDRDQTRVHVTVSSPTGRLLFSYRGAVRWNVTQVTREPSARVVHSEREASGS